MKALHIAASGMTAQEANVTTLANNLANVNTTGFKKGRAEFEDLLYQTLKDPGAQSSSTTNYSVGTQLGSGAHLSGVRKIHTPGSPVITNNPFDLMINGEGFFGITGGGNTRYTRDGSFSVDQSGTLVNRSGETLFPGIVVPPNVTHVNISSNGNVDAYFKDQKEPQSLGQIPVFTFINPAGLKAEGNNLLSESGSSGPATQGIPGEANAGLIQQGQLEASNVNVMEEMTGLIKAQRAYELNSKVMGIADQMLQTVNNIR